MSAGRSAAAATRRFKPYPAYKNSGVEWLGEIPAHWEVTPLKHVANFINGFAFKPDEWGLEGTPIIRIENLNGGENFNCTTRKLPAKYCADKGDLLFGWSGNRGTSFGPFLWWRDGTHYVNQHIFRIVDFDIDKTWMYWALRGVTFYVEKQAHGIIGMVHVTRGELGSIPIPVLPRQEQEQIAQFLEREHAKIDALVAKKERLIELLQEKRTALITRAVTKGLDLNVPMKDSGIEWLGEIPAHWEPKRLVRLTSPAVPIVYGILLPGPRLEEGVPYIGAGDVVKERLRIDSLPRTTEEIASQYPRSRVRGGEIVYAIRGSFGAVEVVPSELEGVNLSRDAARVAPRSTAAGGWLCWGLRSDTSQRQFDFHELGATITGVNIRDLKRVMLPCPPTVEQIAIADYLDRETAKLDALVAKVRDAIERLEELRTALISAAVTGKIDVREEAA